MNTSHTRTGTDAACRRERLLNWLALLMLLAGSVVWPY
jgi:hypothetical protein